MAGSPFTAMAGSPFMAIEGPPMSLIRRVTEDEAMPADSPDHIAAAIEHLKAAFAREQLGDDWTIVVRPGHATLTRAHGQDLTTHQQPSLTPQPPRP